MQNYTCWNLWSQSDGWVGARWLSQGLEGRPEYYHLTTSRVAERRTWREVKQFYITREKSLSSGLIPRLCKYFSFRCQWERCQTALVCSLASLAQLAFLFTFFSDNYLHFFSCPVAQRAAKLAEMHIWREIIHLRILHSSPVTELCLPLERV